MVRICGLDVALVLLKLSPAAVRLLIICFMAYVQEWLMDVMVQVELVVQQCVGFALHGFAGSVSLMAPVALFADLLAAAGRV